MSRMGDLVESYHRKMHPDHLGYTLETIPPDLLARLRCVHDEEVAEVAEAWDTLEEAGPFSQQVAAAHLLHELADVVIVAYSTAAYIGVDLEQVLDAVMWANMGKRPPAGGVGKATKPPGWEPADNEIRRIVDRAGQRQPSA